MTAGTRRRNELVGADLRRIVDDAQLGRAHPAATRAIVSRPACATRSGVNPKYL